MKLQEKNDFSSSLYKNMDLTSISVMIGFDPVVEYLKELTKRFGHVALFFINNMEPKEILITWKPQAFLPTKFRAITSNGLITLSKELVRRKEEEEEEEEDIRTYAIPNIFEILSEMQKDGQGMVESIQISPFEDI
jgi:U3 small nucleolar RNA-associated protein 22